MDISKAVLGNRDVILELSKRGVFSVYGNHHTELILGAVVRYDISPRARTLVVVTLEEHAERESFINVGEAVYFEYLVAYGAALGNVDVLNIHTVLEEGVGNDTAGLKARPRYFIRDGLYRGLELVLDIAVNLVAPIVRHIS